MATDRDIEKFVGDSFTSIWDLEQLSALLTHPDLVVARQSPGRTAFADAFRLRKD